MEKNKKAWKIFLNRYGKLIYWAIHQRIEKINSQYQQNDIEDIFQEVFLTLFEKNKLNQLKNIKFLPGWLAMVSSNKTIDYMRKKYNNREDLTIDFAAFKDNNFKESLLNREDFILVNTIIGNLSNKEKIIISLNILEEKTHQEIADITRLSINTISTIIARTKEKIKNNLEEMKEK
ncbi:MAG: sigma-70 family RNA polymerase sigma factor [Candidatus Omnitrophica bacterium]|nr:sigma-70 family RNA polymerase sigma factor [Candidatus Omnitrophota bacterium]MCF7877547.1 sigma-70 family RNA polymerase sigma factor [Candidatus Omnitrophota bacterium]MCF7893260.1 sigma-70 family RNA polymerase sigma factor [Candidatus Omnitrophota bacterium]